MTVTLGGIALSDHLILTGIETSSGVSVNSRRLLGGTVNHQVAAVIGGRDLALNGDGYHFTLDQITAVKVLEAIRQPVELVHPRGILTVLITGTPVEPEEPLADQQGDSWYGGEILLREA